MHWLLGSVEIDSGKIEAEEIGFVWIGSKEGIGSEEGIEVEVIGFEVHLQKRHRLQYPYHCHSLREIFLSSPRLEICLRVDV